MPLASADMLTSDGQGMGLLGARFRSGAIAIRLIYPCGRGRTRSAPSKLPHRPQREESHSAQHREHPLLQLLGAVEPLDHRSTDFGRAGVWIAGTLDPSLSQTVPM